MAGEHYQLTAERGYKEAVFDGQARVHVSVGGGLVLCWDWGAIYLTCEDEWAVSVRGKGHIGVYKDLATAYLTGTQGALEEPKEQSTES